MVQKKRSSLFQGEKERKEGSRGKVLNMKRPLIIGILVSGRGSNLQAIIDNITKGELHARIGCVISDNKNALALKRAKRANIPAYYIYSGMHKTFLAPECEEKYIKCLKKHQVELVCLAGFMRILHKPFLKAFEHRMINIHPALLPSFKGLNAQKQALEYGVKVSGATVHFVDEGTDTGPIIIQRPVEVRDDDTVESLSSRILRVEHKIYSEAIELYAERRLEIVGRKVRIKTHSLPWPE
jgi:phosphoribosylglycinamide formyltransferase-1